jgi:carbonic anhydrase
MPGSTRRKRWDSRRATRTSSATRGAALCQERLGADASDIDFLPFGDVEQSVRDDVALIRSSPLIPNEINVRGFIYDVKTGKLQEVA